VGPYEVVESYPSHTYKLEKQNQMSVQNESRLNLYKPCQATQGQAPGLLEATRRPNMKGVAGKRKQASDLLTETTDIPGIPAVDKAAGAASGVVPSPGPDERKRLAGEISRLLEGLGRDQNRGQ
jgi:hypothetical protein